MSGRKNNPPCFVSLISASLCDAPPSCTTAAFGHILSCIVRTCGLYTSHILSGLCGAMAPRGPQPPPAEARYLDVLRRVLPPQSRRHSQSVQSLRLAENRKKNGRGCAVENAARACPCGVLGASRQGFTELSAWRMPSAPPFGSSGDKWFLAGKTESKFPGHSSSAVGPLVVGGFPTMRFRCRACGACGIREVQNAGQRIVNSELFLSLQPYRQVFPIGRTHSSVGQSSGLIIRRSWDHALWVPRIVEGLHFLAGLFSFWSLPSRQGLRRCGTESRSAGRSPFGVIRAGSPGVRCTHRRSACVHDRRTGVSARFDGRGKKVLPLAVRPFCSRVSCKIRRSIRGMTPLRVDFGRHAAGKGGAATGGSGRISAGCASGRPDSRRNRRRAGSAVRCEPPLWRPSPPRS